METIDFKYYNGIGSTIEFIEPISLLYDACKEVSPNYFISASALIGSNLDTKELSLPPKVLEQQVGVDSAGFQILSNREVPGRFPPQTLAALYMGSSVKRFIGPDTPMPNVEDHENLVANIIRHELFYEVFEKPEDAEVIHAIHGEFIDEAGEFSLDSRQRWFDCFRAQPFGELCDGYGLKLVPSRGGRANRRDLVASAYFLLQPWAAGETNIHVFAGGGITHLPLLVYIAKVAYEKVTSDSKTYCIDSIANWSIRRKNAPKTGAGPLRSVKLHHPNKGKKRFDPSTVPNDCHCPGCQHYRNLSGKSLIEATNDRLKRHKDAEQLSKRWIVAHNVYLVEQYVQELIALVTDLQQFECYLRSYGMEETLLAVRLVDRLLEDGRDQYPRNIKLVQKEHREHLKADLL